MPGSRPVIPIPFVEGWGYGLYQFPEGVGLTLCAYNVYSVSLTVGPGAHVISTSSRIPKDTELMPG